MIIGKKVKEALSGEFVKTKPRIKLSQGETLKHIRKKHNLIQGQLAELCGLTQATISSLENDLISLGVERAKALARILKVHPAVLVFSDWDESEAA